MPSFRELLLAHSGRPIAILGGGPSLPAQAARLPADCVKISVNEHGVKLTSCDYIVAIDNKAEHRAKLLALGVPVVCPFAWGAYTVHEAPQLSYSSQHAAWLAWLMGGYPILLAGMDLYRGGSYWHDLGAKTPGVNRTLEGHVKSWQVCRDVVPAEIRTMGGILSTIFPLYDSAEVLPAYVEPERARLLKLAAGSVVRIKVETRIAGQLLQAGVIVELPRQIAQKLVAQRRATLQGV